MPELDTITIKGFKSIACIEELKLRAINVVIRPNGAGKSNFIGVFDFLHSLREGHLQDYVMKAGGADKVLYFGARTTEKLEIHISFKDGVNQYAITLRATEADQLYPSDEVVYFWNKQQYPEEPYGKGLSPHGTEAGISAPQYPGIAEHVRSHLNRWRVYHFHDTSSHSPMKKTAMEVLN